MFRDEAVNGGLMRQWTESHSVRNVIRDQGIVGLHVQYPRSNPVPERPFSQDWKDVQDRVRDALTTCFMADIHYSS
jgi:hypothetical protein